MAKSPPFFKPMTLLFPVKKDSSTFQYITQIKQRTPLVPIKLALDLGGEYVSIDCQKHNYVSSTYRPVSCGSAQCLLANDKTCRSCTPQHPISKPQECKPHICLVNPYNPVAHIVISGAELGQDIVSVQSTNGSNPGGMVYVPNFLFSCADTSFLEGLTNGVKGIAGLGKNKLGLPYQFASDFNLSRKFSICLSSSTTSYGVIFIGVLPNIFRPNNIDLSKFLTYTTLINFPPNMDDDF
ncbi:hypothetical protein FEM48_Zijuj07G0131600 [Ziziphus jujuba var. spinosa]|uniref:Xylanase inhibitor N-terminal domain-containing protein n=1 Tax=Ziziphus jujuba var. spinosa TaxID=714518 RepID=A0A978V4U1_ZIZJJ|nr:hypothetical protein FEM48_Zijuj07G0131600 [Ziziphus jujuba var. spinosa]